MAGFMAVNAAPLPLLAQGSRVSLFREQSQRKRIALHNRAFPHHYCTFPLPTLLVVMAPFTLAIHHRQFIH